VAKSSSTGSGRQIAAVRCARTLAQRAVLHDEARANILD